LEKTVLTMAKPKTSTKTKSTTKSSSKAKNTSTLAESQVQGPEIDNRERALLEERECRRLVHLQKQVELDGAQYRLSALRGKLQKIFVDRNEAIDALLASLISRAGCVMLGPPGTAKSMLVRTIAEECSLIKEGNNANYFEYLLTAHTMPEEIFGPTDISRLLAENPEVTRRTEGRLPHAEIAFLDEVFRGGSHILNTLLTILNERKYHNGREVEDVPLISFIGAANYPPHTEELRALFDRFPVRIWVDSVLKSRSSAQMSTHAAHLLFASYPGQVGAHAASASHEKMSTKDFRRLWADLYVRLGKPNAQDKRLTEFLWIFQKFQKLVGLSDRAFTQLWLFAGALDIVRGGHPTRSVGERGYGHIECFKFVADKLENTIVVKRTVEEAYKHYGSNGP
jgi:MoxR-like ATPase